MSRISLAEGASMSLQDRYTHALDSLRKVLAELQDLSTKAVQSRRNQKDIEKQEMFYQKKWEEGLEFARTAFGSDVTEFALIRIKAEHRGH